MAGVTTTATLDFATLINAAEATSMPNFDIEMVTYHDIKKDGPSGEYTMVIFHGVDLLKEFKDRGYPMKGDVDKLAT